MTNLGSDAGELWEQCARELAELSRARSAGGEVDSAPAGVLDVIYAYRLLLGRWPEFATLDAYRRRAGGQALGQFVGSIVDSEEFRSRRRAGGDERGPANWIHEVIEQCRRELGLVERVDFVHRTDEAPAGVLDTLWGT